MALETATYINGLVATNPVATDGLAQADDHMRLIKATIKATFPNITGPVTVTQADLNAPPVPAFPSGTRMLFQQTAAPTGWTKDTSHNDKALHCLRHSRLWWYKRSVYIRCDCRWNYQQFHCRVNCKSHTDYITDTKSHALW